jgi:putative ABC transport system permease protein
VAHWVAIASLTLLSIPLWLFLWIPWWLVRMVYGLVRSRSAPDFPSPLPDWTMVRLGRQNTRRNPQRTASTAAALMIGLALVTLVAILAASIVGSFTGAVKNIFVADYALTASNNFTPIPTAVGDAIRSVDGVTAVASVRAGSAATVGPGGKLKTVQLTGVTPGAATAMKVHWKDGSDAVYAKLGDSGAFVDDGYAKSHHLHVGSPLTLLTPSYKLLHVTVRGVFKPPTGGSPFGPVTISSALFDKSIPNPTDIFSLISIRGGESTVNTRKLEAALKPFPIAKVQTKQQFIDNQTQGLTIVLNVLFVLLAFSIVISFFGIVNTLVLTVFERTREIGMLRAIGMTRRQTRRVIRHESVITAVIGGVLGIGLGIVFGILLVSRIKEFSLHFPVGQLIVFGFAAVIVGILAAIFPARRAAKLNPLEALQYE